MLAFFSTFTKEKIINCFARVGYVPFTRACLKSENIRHELGEDTEDTTLKDLVQEYEQAKIELMDEGFNVEGIFDAEIPTAAKVRRNNTEEDQVKALVARKGGFSASSIFTNIGTMCITSGAILKAQRIQLENDRAAQVEKELKKSTAETKRLQDAQKVNLKRLKGEKLMVSDLKSVIMYVIAASGSSDKPYQYSTGVLIKARLAELDKDWWEYIPEDAQEAVEEDEIGIEATI